MVYDTLQKCRTCSRKMKASQTGPSHLGRFLSVHHNVYDFIDKYSNEVGDSYILKNKCVLA